MKTRYEEMPDFELHMHVTRLAEAWSRAYAADPYGNKTGFYGRYYEAAAKAWSMRQFITVANTIGI